MLTFVASLRTLDTNSANGRGRHMANTLGLDLDLLLGSFGRVLGQDARAGDAVLLNVLHCTRGRLANRVGTEGALATMLDLEVRRLGQTACPHSLKPFSISFPGSKRSKHPKR